MDRSLRHLDGLICPSQSTRYEHARRGIRVPTVHLPYFLPEDYPNGPRVESPRHERPYFAAAGRLEKIKGFQDVIEAMRPLPHLDLRIAGCGQYESVLREQTLGMKNVHFEGRLDSAGLAALFRGALAVTVPSLVYETFGYVVLEAFHEGTPVVVRDLGALPELVAESGGGLTFDSPGGLVDALDRIASDADLREELGANGRETRYGPWSEQAHLGRYFDLIDDLGERRARRGSVGRVAATVRPASSPEDSAR